MMHTLLVGALAFILGYGLGGGTIIRRVQSGRIVLGGRIYLCKDTGPEVR